MEIVVDDLSGPEIAAFLEQHVRDMLAITPPESKHALDLDALRRPEITFWSVRIPPRGRADRRGHLAQPLRMRSPSM